MRPEWDNQFRETESERNARLRAKRLKKAAEQPRRHNVMCSGNCYHVGGTDICQCGYVG